MYLYYHIVIYICYILLYYLGIFFCYVSVIFGCDWDFWTCILYATPLDPGSEQTAYEWVGLYEPNHPRRDGFN